MKKIAILTCLDATKVCSGAACFRAFNNRDAAFENCPLDTELIAFFHCNGCKCDYEHDTEYIEKIETLHKLGIDELYIGKCTKIKGVECAIIQKIILQLSSATMIVTKGTH